MCVRRIVTLVSILKEQLLCHCFRKLVSCHEFSPIRYVAQKKVPSLMHGAIVCALRGAFKSDFWLLSSHGFHAIWYIYISPVLKSSTVEFDNYQNILPPNQYLQKTFWPNIVPSFGTSFGTGPPHIYKGFTKGKIQKIHYGP